MAKDLNYLGVDIGASGIKIVELASEGGRARLATFGFSEYEAEKATDVLENPEAKGKELADLAAKAGVTTKRAVTGLPMASVFSTLFTYPEGTEKGLEEMIKSKAKKLSPIPEADLVIDWKKLAPLPNEKMVKVAVTAASRTMIEKYMRIFRASGFTLLSLETEAYAMVRALLGKDRSPAMIVDIGSIKTNVLMVKDSVPVIHRTVKAGGRDISDFLAEKMKVDIKQAEEMKKNLSLNKLAGAEAALAQIVEPIVNEIKFCESLYNEQYHDGTIEKVVLTGGSSLLGHLAGYISRILNINTYLGDPWARVIFPTELKPVLDRLGARFAVAIGLAMRNIE